MTHHPGSQRRPHQTPSWWVVGAWASLVLLAAGGLAGAAGLG
ncbi:molybdopterin oxidoreductase [uncultured Cellulomonas sp.]|nr:molybdopterin oxidoreductase [uncultured Cellulomonas sp.]